MKATTIGEVRLELTVGDIASQEDLDAVVNAANAQLQTGGGVAGALHRAAGPDLAEACAPLAPIEPGECVITDAFALPNRHVVHALGPVYGVNEPAADLLASCYRNALRLADRHRLVSIGFPALSTGIFAYPAPAAAEVAVATVIDEAPRLDHVRLIRFVLFSDHDLEVVRDALAAHGSG